MDGDAEQRRARIWGKRFGELRRRRVLVESGTRQTALAPANAAAAECDVLQERTLSEVRPFPLQLLHDGREGGGQTDLGPQ